MTSDFTIGDATRYKAIIEGNTIKIKDLELFLKDWRTMKEKAENWNRLVGDPEGYIEKCRQNIKKLEAIKPILKQIEQSTNSRPPRVSLEGLHLNEQWLRVWEILKHHSSGGSADK